MKHQIKANRKMPSVQRINSVFILMFVLECLKLGYKLNLRSLYYPLLTADVGNIKSVRVLVRE